jgi:hypothetical protein
MIRPPGSPETALEIVERYSKALLRKHEAEPANDARTKKSPPQQGLLRARATGLEPATSGVTGRRSKPTELRPHGE